ncbi:MAG: restriction endonuclease [Burkholderiaceae bacterium]|nr:restriction endonuclease [Burkholderiaceae bacterium]
MAEPTVTGVAIAASAITISGSFLGVGYDALLAGLAGGVISLSYLPTMTKKRVAGSLITSSLLAGFFSPVFTMAAENSFPAFLKLGNFSHITIAAFLGMGAQVIIPRVLKMLSDFEVKK